MSKQDNVIKLKQNNGKWIALGIVIAILIALLIFWKCFHINEMKVVGQKHYSEEQIKDFVLENGYIDNTVLLMLKNRIKPISDIPFIDKIDIEYINANTVNVTVYEKAMAGCVEYMEQFVYFDQDGVVLEMSGRRIQDVPCITGLNFETMELHEKLPIKDKKRFKIILKLTQMINENNIDIDGIKFNVDGEIILKHKDIEVLLGDGSLVEAQLTDLAGILEKLDGMKGTLDMRGFDPAEGRASFKVKGDKTEAPTEETSENTEETTENNEEGEEGT